ncbi:MAG: NADH-quinone oxidoreductase subunit L [Pseudonocardiales bacterium]|nr:MAG: NADH-quinone oxidoreductase subunit L [Pseudonocardiales bacterium]
MTTLGWLVLGLPFAAAVVGFLLPQTATRSAQVLTVSATGVATVLSIIVATGAPVAGKPGVTLAPFGTLTVHAGLRLDGLATIVAVAVCVVALLVQFYSIAYLAGDDAYPRYAAQVSLFTAAMLDVVLAADLIQLLVGWEVMGICSYLLIGHYRDLPEARPAAVKAFLVTRVGDVGFLLGVLVLGVGIGSFDIGTVIAHAGSMPSGTLVTACLLLLLGVAGKSAQFPLHTWLPDAMAGPTPISALIHAATMVAAGIYVVARLYPVFRLHTVALAVLGVVAAITMLLGALAALGQDDLKRVLAWSTVSQIAYMSGALAVGAPVAATFHLLTHAAFKALLFLAAGCVLNATGEVLMSSMGGLRRRLPITFWTMTCGLAALVGLPPTSGFFSKDAVLGGAWEAARGHGGGPAWVGWLVGVAGLLTVGLTAAYATRLWLRTFFGPAHEPAAAHETGHAHGPGHVHGPWVVREPCWIMTVPLIVLAVPTVLLGFAGLRSSWLPARLDAPGVAVHPTLGIALVSLALSAGGIAWVVLAWRRAPGTDPVPALPVLTRAFYLDDVQDAVIVRPYRLLARIVSAADAGLVDGAVEGSGAGAGMLSRRLSRLQTGNVQFYATGVLAAAVLLAVAAVLL